METQTRTDFKILPERAQLPFSATDWRLQYTGLAFILVSGLVFMLPEWGITAADGSTLGIFLLNYGLAAGYFLVMAVKGRFSLRRPFRYLEPLYLLQVLAILSCYSLNREMNIFQDSATWLELAVTLFCAALAAYSFRERLPLALQAGLLFVLGAGLVLWVYYALYLMPFYLIGAVGLVGLGISGHTFVPLWLVLSLGLGARKTAAGPPWLLPAFFAGTLFPLLFGVFFLVQWYQRLGQIQFSGNEFVLQNQERLPRWVSLSQQLPADYLTERMMKTDLVYQVPRQHITAWQMPTGNFSEVKRHDPLVMTAAFLLGKPDVDEKEKVKILESLYDARHQAEERLWAGNNLSTSNVVSQVKLFPRHRLAYTEKVLRVHNNTPRRWSQQEAIYTFFLPEGSVVSSLSLWINGREEKALLTTKTKAQKAYNTIVGVEVRDPSVVHWQEGNRVSVRVFPCTPQENRQFKIGVTSPLHQQGTSLVYENVYFTGPSTQNAVETSVVYLEDPVQNLQMPGGYQQVAGKTYKRQGSYEAGWSLRFSAPALAASKFSFGGSGYQLVALPQQLENFEPHRIYLDLNASWSEKEFEQVWQRVKNKKVYAWEGQMTRLSEANRKELFQVLRRQRFSLFPLHLLQESDQALVISKSTEVSPNLSDLKDTPFARDMAAVLPGKPPVRVFALGAALSPYLKGLKELRVIAPMQGSPGRLFQLLQQKQFVRTATDAGTVRLGASGLGIARGEAGPAGPAPDHLLRLFAYNHLLQQLGSRYFCPEEVEEELVAEAAQAHIVSPVSSLIVLEKQADYERFDIAKSSDSLGNASMRSSGAVPEPEEWALIILAVLAVGFLTLKPYLLR
ncbi:MAG: XrtN system VIT domain-containing protein [Adhaeribacter sp.]